MSLILAPKWGFRVWEVVRVSKICLRLTPVGPCYHGNENLKIVTGCYNIRPANTMNLFVNAYRSWCPTNCLSTKPFWAYPWYQSPCHACGLVLIKEQESCIVSVKLCNASVKCISRSGNHKLLKNSSWTAISGTSHTVQVSGQHYFQWWILWKSCKRKEMATNAMRHAGNQQVLKREVKDRSWWKKRAS